MAHYLAVSAFRRPQLLASLVFACSVASGCSSDGDDSAAPSGGSGGESGAAYAGSAVQIGAGGSPETAAGATGAAAGGSSRGGAPAGGAAAGGASAGDTAGGADEAGAAGSAGAGEAGGVGALPTATFSLKRTDLDSDQAGAAVTDARLLNAWGIAINPTAEVFWVSSNQGGTTPVYDATGALKPLDPKVPALTGTGLGSPTGQIFNSGANFMGDKFVVDTADGQIAGWPGTGDFVKRAAKTDAIYRGLAAVGTGASQMLLATDFHAGTVDAYGPAYEVVTKAGAFVDATIPAGFAPFNVVPIRDKVYVTYAKQDAGKVKDAPGAGNGYVTEFAQDGTYQKTLIARRALNSPWAVALAPASFGALANTLLVGNFGDGAIHAFDLSSGALVGELSDAGGNPLIIFGLWDLKVGPSGTTDLSNTLFFTAGPGGGAHGVFGKLEAAPAN